MVNVSKSMKLAPRDRDNERSHFDHLTHEILQGNYRIGSLLPVLKGTLVDGEFGNL